VRLALITENFPPLRNSGAVQLRDLSREFARQGHELTILLPDAGIQRPWLLEMVDGVEVLRFRAPRTKGIGYFQRTLAEFMMPFAMRRQLMRSPFAMRQWDGVVWYSPSIFHGPLASSIKKASGCKGYLIIRDIFPEWALDMELMGRGLPYLFFDVVARYQYSVADVIGIQTPSNSVYFAKWVKKTGRRLEVLKNWLDKPGQKRCSIRVDQTSLSERKIFVYAGNMGVAQGVNVLLDLAEKLRFRKDVGFLFVGRGSEEARLKAAAQSRQLDNVVFFDEIDPDEIPDLYAQCDVGILALDPRHKSHNIPGKFLTYMQSGLPVLANINRGNDLAKIIRAERVGQVCENNQVDDLILLAEKVIDQIAFDAELSARCANLFEREFSVKNTVTQIVAALSAT